MKTPRKGKKEDHLSAELQGARLVNDRELILSAQGGDLEAFEELVQKYDRHILSLAFSFARNSDDAKDIYQETLLRAYRSISKFEMRSEFSTWLFRIATNVCISFKSRQKRYTEVFGRETMPSHTEDGEFEHEHPTEDTVEGDFMRGELRLQIETALAALSPMQRLVFTMKHYEGYKLREIAAATNCAEGTVKKYLFEAVRRLQRELERVV